MPELPEVETTARLVRPRVVGRTILGEEVRWARTLGGMRRAAFRKAVVGARIVGVRRRAKQVVLDLERDGEPAGAIAVHLRMTGRLYVDPSSEPLDPYVRVALPLDDGRTLSFLDVRKFGRFVYVEDAEAFLAHLGPEPLDAAFTPQVLWDRLRTRRRMIKPLLLDQGFVAGLGNIYVDECLHRIRVHPERRADTIRRAQAFELHEAIQEVLHAAIARQGSSFDGFYRTPEGQPGSYQHEFRVYGKAGQPCPRCASPIRRFVVGQRGTHACLRCQRPPRQRA